MNLYILAALFCSGWVAAQPFTAGDIPPETGATADQIIARMIERDAARRSALARYTASRLYVAANKRFHKSAEVAVRETYAQPGTKTLEVVSVKGSGFIRRRAIDKLIEAELDASQASNRDQTRIGPEHYTFRLVGAEILAGRPAIVLEVNPRHEKKYLMRGRIWIDKEDLAIVRMEVSPAKNPSFWTRNVRIVRVYEKHGQFWLPARMESESDIRIVGKSTLRIDYGEYKVGGADPQQPAGHSQEGSK